MRRLCPAPGRLQGRNAGRERVHGVTGRLPVWISIAAMLAFGVVRRGLGLIGMASLARLLSPAEVGAYAFTQSTGQTFVGLMRLGALQGLHVALARRLAEPQGGAGRPGDGETGETRGAGARTGAAPAAGATARGLAGPDRDEIGALIGGGLLLVTGIATLGSALMLALAGPIAAGLFGAPELAPFMAAAALAFAGLFLSRGVYVIYAGLGAFVAYARWGTAAGLGVVLATVLGAVFFGVAGAVWGFAGATFLGAPLSALGLRPVLGRAGLAPRWRLRAGHLREVFAVGLPFYGAGVAMVPAAFVAQGIVSWTGGVAELADLRIVLALMAVVQMVPQAVSGPVISLFSAREGAEAGAGRRAAFEHMKWLWILALVSGAALAVVWPFAVTLVFGPGYGQAAALGPLAILAFLPVIVGTALSAGILVGGRTRPLLAVGLLEGALMAGGALVLVPRLGLAGFFVAQGLAGTAAALAWLWVLARQTGTAPGRRWMVPLALATLAFGAAVGLDGLVAESAGQRLGAGTALVLLLTGGLAGTVLGRAERARLWRRGRAGLAGGLVAARARFGRVCPERGAGQVEPAGRAATGGLRPEGRSA